MSYNILADALAQQHAHELYPHTPRHLLAWPRRWALALQEVRTLDPDVLCRQVGDLALPAPAARSHLRCSALALGTKLPWAMPAMLAGQHGQHVHLAPQQ
jgi:hypothetical protein